MTATAPYWLVVDFDTECAGCTVDIDPNTPIAYLSPTERGDGGQLLCRDCWDLWDLVEHEATQRRAEAAR